MELTLEQKEQKLNEILKSYEKIVIGYSGGVDSTFLSYIASKVLGENALCVTMVAELHSKREIAESIEFAKEHNLNQKIIEVSIVENDFIKNNPVDRCYHCKTTVFSIIKNVCKENGFNVVVDGTNVDDLQDYRPGLKALDELQVKSPLFEAGLTKNDIRELSKKYGLDTFDKPSFACLASRVPYNTEITKEKLEQVEKCENFLFDKGFKQLRVRHMGNLARIEVSKEERSKFFDEKLLDEIDEKFKSFGFSYVAFEVGGYKMGSLNVNL